MGAVADLLAGGDTPSPDSLVRKPGGSIKDLLESTAAPPEAPHRQQYIGRAMDIPSDIWAVLTEGAGKTGEALSSGGRAEFESKSPSERGLASGQRGFGLIGGIWDMLSSPLKGPARSMAVRPIAENFMSDEAASRERFESAEGNWFQRASKRGLTSGQNIHEPPLAGPQTTEEKVKQLETGTDFLLPGLGVVKYGALAKNIAGTPLARGLEKIFSPTTVDRNATTAEALLREHGGTAARETEQARAALDVHHKVVNQLSDIDRLAFLAHVESGTATTGGLPAPLQSLGTQLRDAFARRWSRLTSMPKYAQAQFVQNFFPHMWKDPNAGAQMGQQHVTGGPGSGSKQGSGASLKKRTIPTISDGIAAGLQPITTDPIDMAMRYIASMDKFIAAEAAFEEAKSTGMIRLFRPKVVGASGHPEAFKVPAGWEAIKGRGSDTPGGYTAYAPEGFARVYNNFLSRGIYDIQGKDYGQAYNVALRASNAITSMELGLSGYHLMTMLNESGISHLARGIHDIVGGAFDKDLARSMSGGARVAKTLANVAAGTAGGAVVGGPVGAAVGALGSVLYPAAKAISAGSKLEKVYLGLSQGTPNMARITNLLEKAGGRGTASRHALDYQYSAMGNYWRAWRMGALKGQLIADRAEMAANPLMGSLKVGFRHIGRVMQTVAMPIFEVTIPKLKNGAFYDMMHGWLEANHAATYEQQLAAARQIWDSVDNRFGEMVNDNVFWNNLLKQSAMLAMRSYSWNLGTAREIGGGVKDLLGMGTAGAAAGQQRAATAMGGPWRGAQFRQQGGSASQHWTPRAAYVIALPIWAGTINAVYQYIKTGQGPQSVDDLVAGRTGGDQTLNVPRARGFGKSTPSSAPERVMVPGYQKDVFGWYENPKQEAMNKLATGIRLPIDLIRNKDWRGLPISDDEGSTPEWLKAYMGYVIQAMNPISSKQIQQGRPQGSNISTPESLMGLRPAPPFLANPDAYDRMQHNLNTREQRHKKAVEKRREQKYGGPD